MLRFEFRYSGDATNALQYVIPSSCYNNFANGMKFSTYDTDNDLNSGDNCASRYGGGWWYYGCYVACLTCINSYWSVTTGGCNTGYTPDEIRMLMKPQ